MGLLLFYSQIYLLTVYCADFEHSVYRHRCRLVVMVFNFSFFSLASSPSPIGIFSLAFTVAMCCVVCIMFQHCPHTHTHTQCCKNIDTFTNMAMIFFCFPSDSSNGMKRISMHVCVCTRMCAHMHARTFNVRTVQQLQ